MASEVINRFTPLFYPKSVAIIGASNDARKWGFGVLHNIIRAKFAGKIYPINRREKLVCGLQAYPSIKETPEAVDLAIITIPPEAVPETLSECVGKGVKAVVVITAGFGEVGVQEKKLQDKIARIAEEGNLLMIGPNCQGVMCSHSLLSPQIYGVFPLPGPFSMVSQSGNVGGSLLQWSKYQNTGFSKFVSSGNEATTSCEDLIEYFGEDTDTGVILCYLEGVGDGRRFLEVSQRATRRKPLILLKGGKTRAGARAVSSHTGKMSGSDEVFAAVCRQAGVIQVNDLQELFDLGMAFARQPLPRGNRVGIVTVGGGWGVLAADTCLEQGLEVVPLPAPTRAKLDEILPPRWSHNNPVDLAAAQGRDTLSKCLTILLSCPEIDGVIQIGVGMGTQFKEHMDDSPFFPVEIREKLCNRADENDRKTAESILNAMKEYRKPVTICSDNVGSYYEQSNMAIRALREQGIMVYSTPERAVRAMAALARYSDYRRKYS